MMECIRKILFFSVCFVVSVGSSVLATQGFDVHNDTAYPIVVEVSFQYGAHNKQNRTVSIAPNTLRAIQPSGQEKPGIIEIHTIRIQLPNNQVQLLSVEQQFPYREIVVGACRAHLTVMMQSQNSVGYRVFFACQ